MPYQFSRSFYIKQCWLLVLTGLVFLLISRNQTLDIYLSDMWFSSQSQSFPLLDNYWLAVVNHVYVKNTIITCVLGIMLLGLVKRRYDWLIIALIIIAGPLVVSALKSVSTHSCPWDLVRYGGDGWEYPLLGPVSEMTGKGGCFPGGHASGGFALLGLFFIIYPYSKKWATTIAMCALCLGLLMGFGQVMRGAHFFSHNLWSAWWVWLTQLSLYFIYSSVLLMVRCKQLLTVKAQ